MYGLASPDWGMGVFSLAGVDSYKDNSRLGGLESDWTRVTKHVEREKSPAKDHMLFHGRFIYWKDLQNCIINCTRHRLDPV